MNKPSRLASLFAATLIITLSAVIGVTVPTTAAPSDTATAAAVYDTATITPVATAVATAAVPIAGVPAVVAVVTAAPEVAVALAALMAVLAVFVLALAYMRTALGRERLNATALHFIARGPEHQWSTQTRTALRRTKERVMRLQPAYTSRLMPG